MYVRRLRFFRYSQKPGRRFDNFWTQLQMLANEADLNSLSTEDLLVFRIVGGCSDDLLREKFLRLSNPSLSDITTEAARHMGGRAPLSGHIRPDAHRAPTGSGQRPAEEASVPKLLCQPTFGWQTLSCQGQDLQYLWENWAFRPDPPGQADLPISPRRDAQIHRPQPKPKPWSCPHGGSSSFRRPASYRLIRAACTMRPPGLCPAPSGHPGPTIHSVTCGE